MYTWGRGGGEELEDFSRVGWVGAWVAQWTKKQKKQKLQLEVRTWFCE